MITFKKKVTAALGAVAVVGASVALTAGTFSYFSDSATINGASGNVTMGTLKLDVGNGTNSTPFAITNVAPGATVLDKTITFHNTGSLDGALRLKIVPDPNNTDAFNAAVIIKLDGFGFYPASVGLNGEHSLAYDAELTKAGVLASPMFGSKDPRAILANDGGRYKSIPITVSIDPTASNALQGATGGFTIQADLLQASATVANGSTGGIPADPNATFQAPAAN